MVTLFLFSIVFIISPLESNLHDSKDRFKSEEISILFNIAVLAWIMSFLYIYWMNDHLTEWMNGCTV